jgi:hypothetical protein
MGTSSPSRHRHTELRDLSLRCCQAGNLSTGVVGSRGSLAEACASRRVLGTPTRPAMSRPSFSLPEC